MTSDPARFCDYCDAPLLESGECPTCGFPDLDNGTLLVDDNSTCPECGGSDYYCSVCGGEL